MNQIKLNSGFWGEGETGVPGKKTSRSRVKNQHTQPIYDAGSGNRTRDKLVGGERSHHCATPARLKHPVWNGSLNQFYRFAKDTRTNGPGAIPVREAYSTIKSKIFLFLWFQCCTRDQTEHSWHIQFAFTIIQRTMKNEHQTILNKPDLLSNFLTVTN